MWTEILEGHWAFLGRTLKYNHVLRMLHYKYIQKS